MNREFKSTSNLLRAAFATAALLTTMLMVGSMTSLAEHYNAESQFAGTQRAVVAHQ